MQTYLVGGAVRDQLLGLAVKDRDWLVVGATPAQMRELGFVPVGKDFPVFINPKTGEEYALARTERKSGHGYQGFTFHTDPSVSLEEDLLRRDLSINAMAMQEDGSIIDPYGGQDDLKAGLLRHVSPAFSEDPLRVLRVARFAARFTPLGFKIAPETLSLMKDISHSGELEHLSAERVWQEFEGALQAEHPVAFLQTLKDAEALGRVMPELLDFDCTRAETVISLLNRTKPDSEQRFALICQIAFDNHHSKEPLFAFCTRLKTPKRFQQAAADLIEWHQTLSEFEQISAEQRFQMIKSLKLLRQPERLTCLAPPTLALHPDAPKDMAPRCMQLIQRLQAVNSTTWSSQGIQGKALGDAMEQAYITLCAAF